MKHVLQIIHWVLHVLRDSEHVHLVFAIMTRIRIMLTGVPAVEMMLDNLLIHYSREDEAFKRVSHEALTGELKELDDERDELFISLKYSNKAALHSRDITKVAAGKLLDALLKSYKKISRVDYPAETALIRHFLADLASPPYAAAATLLGYDPLSARLTVVNNTFDEKWIARIEALGIDLMVGNVRQHRPAVNKALLGLTGTLDTLYASNEATTKDPDLREKLTAAINFINEEVHANVNVLANRGQHYTGHPEYLFDADMQVPAAIAPPQAPPAPFE